MIEYYLTPAKCIYKIVNNKDLYFTYYNNHKWFEYRLELQTVRQFQKLTEIDLILYNIKE